MAAIDFLHVGVPYSGETLRTASLGGTESSVILLAEALARRGHKVSVFNGVRVPCTEYGVNWWPVSEAPARARGDVGIAVASPKTFKGLSFRQPIYWLHNPLKSWRQIRRGNVLPLFRAKPLFVLLGDYHNRKVPRWLPSRGRKIIQHGVQEIFFRREPAQIAPPQQAIFTSQPYRGLEWVLGLWPQIQKQLSAAALQVFAPKMHQALANKKRENLQGVVFAGSVSRQQLIGELWNTRVQLIPGHRDETYCLAAAEATAAGVPIVTLGIGALSERVIHGETGFIARNRDEFIARTVQLLKDDALWLRMHRSCLQHRGLMSWDVRAEQWEQLFPSLG